MAKRSIKIKAELEKLQDVSVFIDSILEEAGCDLRVQMQIDIAVEEIFVNIVSYAYDNGEGDAVISVDIAGDPASAVIEFVDRGKPFDPLAKPDPDVTLSIEERQIGGLGIYMVKKSMDDMTYRYEDGQNILTIRKLLQGDPA